MRRRRLLAGIGSTISLAGCLSSEPYPPDTTSSNTTQTATETPTEACAAIATGFEKPALPKPESLSAEVAEQAGYEVERAYQETLDVSPANFSEVRGHRENSFDYRLLEAPSTELQSSYQVEVLGLVSWTEDRKVGNETTETIHYDRPLRVALYEVTERRVQRRSGIGDLAGTVLCW
ncbi:hypothetical protein SAMN05216559_1888 [Halomicrobium zhouii]|uniref:Uncharacterized protein n=1 Tax=Halomicrobium zhouii TaxID=767519 RepID=A0A1I6L2E1_9EURY|nr:hypothetical protein [Halomicrobium zhouii]SFR97634.1 hypothetical protein SAMN05216559_1888 [Halomicrobium zhouii]